ncbi:beta-1,3-galactosyltransferase brn [Diorhabda sublineata]|uniref:beta-1,3-galactosyltransferase brn n=1 Tax=Diorhabda sublineata TaxID=1163346 RepID=UPI0024E0F8E7|nr:beta-1,3-galactosyltransferase brn [Diorhabda sublineata]
MKGLFIKVILNMICLKKRLKNITLLLVLVMVLYFFGAFHHFFERDFYNDFHYPYDGDIQPFIEQMKNNVTPEILPINQYSFKYYKTCTHKCTNIKKLRLVYLVKSAPENFDRRIAIRSSWGFERRFSDVEIRTVFLIGEKKSKVLQQSVDEEYKRYLDVVQANFTDSYYNNTYKTMMGIQWAVRYCPNSNFYMYVDDDYYVSTKNVLRFLRHPTNYPQYIKDPFAAANKLLRRRRFKSFEDSTRLYAGYRFHSAPLRHFSSKWFVSLSEYPYHMWPPYITAGAYILSSSALIDMFYASFYTKHFRFDDVYLGLLAFKTKIDPLHCEEFYFYKKTYYRFDYNFTIATHGYSDPKELLRTWTEQKSLGNA